MCGRFVIIPDNLQARFDLIGNLVGFKPNYNAAPSQLLPVITNDQQHNHLELMDWGLIPHWAKERKTGYSMINARVETLLEKPTFKHAFRAHRCIIPANGFFEWQTTESGKQPYYIFSNDQPILALAGIYDLWVDPESGQTTKTYSILTTAARGIMEKIHDRMPVILSKSDEQNWLLETDETKLYDILKNNQTNLAMYPISTLINSPKNNDVTLIQPLDMPTSNQNKGQIL
jgi:putative SOS response-associated peptidase YedK